MKAKKLFFNGVKTSSNNRFASSSRDTILEVIVIGIGKYSLPYVEGNLLTKNLLKSRSFLYMYQKG